jgi:hypothetical protein
MGKIVDLKHFKKHNNKNEQAEFFGQLSMLQTLYLMGTVDKIIIIAEGKDTKCCTSNGITVSTAREMVRNFQLNYKDYVD